MPLRSSSRRARPLGDAKRTGLVTRIRRFVLGTFRDANYRQAGYAQAISAVGGLIAGAALSRMSGTLEALPGLMVLVPGAIGMRGNIFGSLGSRLGTSIQTGTFSRQASISTSTGQNVAASMALSLTTSVTLALLAKAVVTIFGLAKSIGIDDFIAISVVGGIISSVVVLFFTVAIAQIAYRREWDLDSISAPLVTVAGDVVTLPALALATLLANRGLITSFAAYISVLAAVVVTILAQRSSLALLKSIMRESLPTLMLAGAIDIIAGTAVEKRFEAFSTYPALLILVPALLEIYGGAGGLLASRLGSSLHMGLIEPLGFPNKRARHDMVRVSLVTAPSICITAVLAGLAPTMLGLAGPGMYKTLLVVVLASIPAMSAAMAAAHGGAIGAYKLGLDPDNHGIPMVTSTLDLAGAFSLILAMALVGLT